ASTRTATVWSTTSRRAAPGCTARTPPACRRPRASAVGRLREPNEGHEAVDEVAARAREPSVVRELPERRVRLVRERAVDAALAGVVGGERERPLAVALVERGEVARGGLGGAPRLEALVSARAHHEPEAACRGAP